ncbi:MAG: hypothetical protein ACRDS0_40790 [Pseudonocardiaceae bacterium]
MRNDLQQSTELVSAWCPRTGNELLEVRGNGATIRRRRSPDPLGEMAPDQVPGTRLWIYTYFACNLACDYRCAVLTADPTPGAGRRSRAPTGSRSSRRRGA